LHDALPISRARNTFMALALFLICDFSSWQVTTVLVGMCVKRTADIVVLTDCPPAPEDAYVSVRISCSWISISTSSTSGKQATVPDEVWVRSPDSVSGTRCTRCAPFSYFNFE